jgi:hypothetical protein
LETIITIIKNFDIAINAKIGGHIQGAQIEIKDDPNILYILDEDNNERDEPFDERFITPDDEDISIDMFDNLLSAEVLLPRGETYQTGQVIGYKRDHDGNLIGNTHQNPLLNTRLYQVQFDDGSIQDFAANCIAEAIYNEIDDEGNKFLLFKGILSYITIDYFISAIHRWFQMESTRRSQHPVLLRIGIYSYYTTLCIYNSATEHRILLLSSLRALQGRSTTLWEAIRSGGNRVFFVILVCSRRHTVF